MNSALPFCSSGNSSLHPPTLLHLSHINHQSEVAVCTRQTGFTYTPSENQGDQEPCEQSKALVNLAPTTALWLRVLSEVQVSSQTLPLRLGSGNKPVHQKGCREN